MSRSDPEAGPCRYGPLVLCTGGLDPKDLKTALFCISFLRKGEVLAYVGRFHNLKDLKFAFPDPELPAVAV